MDDNGYSADRRLISYRLEQLTEEVKGLRRDVGGIKTDVARLKVRAGTWGLIGSLPALGLVLFKLFFK